MAIAKEKLEAAISAISDSIDNHLGPDMGERPGYVVIMLDPEPRGLIAYATNLTHEGAAQVLKDWLEGSGPAPKVKA